MSDDVEISGPELQAEITAMKVIGETLSALTPPARNRVLNWTADHFGLRATPAVRSPLEHASTLMDETSVDGKEIPGIARWLNERLEILVRDLKARSMVDAAIRLTHIVIFSHERLTGLKSVSSRKVLIPILREWRAYDGNIRTALAQHRGIHRTGDELSLDALSRQEAQAYIEQILDDSTTGSWNPRSRSNRKKRLTQAGKE